MSITVEIVSGQGRDYWPRPGRAFVAARSHTFAALADAINVGFARWDLAHLSEFVLSDGTRIADTHPDLDAPADTVDIHALKLSRLRLDDQFVYTFDFGDDWQHLCTVGPERVDPSRCTASHRTDPCPLRGGEACPTSTDGAGPAMTWNARSLPIPGAETCRLSSLPGAGGP
ncbi:MAG: hypothetical protein KDC36_06065 [Thermoleophilia bacterium]|nr:hypothetical protein [Thermoleophilia bacterium]